MTRLTLEKKSPGVYVSRPASTRLWRKIVFFALGLIAALMRWMTARARARPVSDRRGVILLEPFGMGDVLSLQPLIRELNRMNLPVILCAREPWRQLIPASDIETFIPTEFSWSAYKSGAKYGRFKSFWKGVTDWRRAVTPLAQGAFGFDPRGDVRSILMLYLAGCRKVISFERYYVAASCRVPRHAADELLSVPAGLHRWEVNLRLLSAVTATPALERVPPPTLFPPADRAPRPVSRGEKKTLGLIPMTPWPGKRWPSGHWRELIERIRDKGWDPIALCGPGETGETAESVGSGTHRVECGSIAAWLRALSGCHAVVSVNTGPMHLADALGVPVVLLEGSGQIPLWSPSGSLSVTLHHQEDFPCSPCHQAGDPGCAQRCMRAIEPSEVAEALNGKCPGVRCPGQDGPAT